MGNVYNTVSLDEKNILYLVNDSVLNPKICRLRQNVDQALICIYTNNSPNESLEYAKESDVRLNLFRPTLDIVVLA